MHFPALRNYSRPPAHARNKSVAGLVASPDDTQAGKTDWFPRDLDLMKQFLLESHSVKWLLLLLLYWLTTQASITSCANGLKVLGALLLG